MEKLDSNELIIINEENIKDLIYEIRGQKVMLDFDLARIYGYETRYFNRQVKNNINKFPEDFMFKISDEEMKTILKCKNFTSSWGGTRKKPYVFNEQVKNNIEKFPEDFRFELSNIELDAVLRSKKTAANTLSSKRRYNPYAFTEQGIYMLMTVLKGEYLWKN